jgi:geranylgeranyl pyrophosphate synthase
MFQIVDDVIDVTQEAHHAGKQTGKDAAKGKLTYPGLLGLDASRLAIARLEGEALDAIAPLGPTAAPLAELARYMAVRTH